MMRSVLSRVPWVSCQKFATVDARDCDFAGQGIARLRLRSTLTGESDLRLFFGSGSAAVLLHLRRLFMVRPTTAVKDTAPAAFYGGVRVRFLALLGTSEDPLASRPGSPGDH